MSGLRSEPRALDDRYLSWCKRQSFFVGVAMAVYLPVAVLSGVLLGLYYAVASLV